MSVPAVDPAGVGADVFLLDVREDDEWVAGPAPDAVHIPMSGLLARLDDVPKEQPVVVVCRMGARSAQVTAYLNQNGWSGVRNLDGGMEAWQAAGRPMVSETAAPPQVV